MHSPPAALPLQEVVAPKESLFLYFPSDWQAPAPNPALGFVFIELIFSCLELILQCKNAIGDHLKTMMFGNKKR